MRQREADATERLLATMDAGDPLAIQMREQLKANPVPEAPEPPVIPSLSDARVEHLFKEICALAATRCSELSGKQAHALARFIKQIGGEEYERLVRDLATNGHGYHEKCEVNGIKISIGWDSGYEDFTIYFPQINLQVGWENGVSDQVIRISQDEKDAKAIYDFAVQQAATARGVYALYTLVEERIRETVWG